MLFNISVGNTDSGIERILSKFAEDTKLRGAFNTPAGRDAIQAREVGPCEHHEIQQGHVQGPAHRLGQSRAQIEAEWRIPWEQL